MTEPFTSEEMRLANQALVLRNHGHVNIEKITAIYEVEYNYDQGKIPTTIVEYTHSDGSSRRDPVDVPLTQVILEANELELEQEESAAQAWVLTTEQ